MATSSWLWVFSRGKLRKGRKDFRHAFTKRPMRRSKTQPYSITSSRAIRPPTPAAGSS
jgi:hypothetical protein